MNLRLQQAADHWRYVAPLLTPATNAAEYAALVEALDELYDQIGDDESHALAGLALHLGDLISAYETEHNPMPQGEARHVLAFLMEQHHLSQSDVPEVGAQSVVSEILNGKRQLNVRQIRALSTRFGVSPQSFF